MIRTALTALVLIAGAGQAFAATSADTGAETDAKMKCAFVAEIGGYRCVQPVEHASLSEPTDGNAKKKLIFVQFIDPSVLPNFP